MPSLAKTERAALCDLFLLVGPDAATLCEGWRTRDLAAHLVIREGRPDAAGGVVVGALAGYTKKVQDKAALRSFVDLVKTIRTGPPFWNPMRIGPLAEAVNGLEFLIHHEDVRRAQPEWVPRQLDDWEQDAIWDRLPAIAKLNYRSSPVGVVLRRPEGATATVRSGASTVTLTGAPVELALQAYGRAANRTRIDGDAQDVAVFLAHTTGR